MSRDWLKHHRQNNANTFASNLWQHKNNRPFNANRNSIEPIPNQWQGNKQQWQGHTQHGAKKPYFHHLKKSKTSLPPCSNCKRFFDVRERIPIILMCNHTFCEDCIKKASTNLSVKCFECGELSFGQVGANGSNQKTFAPNYYLIGKLFYQNNNNEFHNSPGASSTGKKECLIDQCHVKDCGEASSIKCVQCSEKYCGDCFKEVHRDKEFEKHDYEEIEDNTVDILPCPQHPGLDLEVFCVDCNVTCCPKCFIRDHQKHESKDATVVDETDSDNIKELLGKCKESLKLLESSRKETVELLGKQHDPKSAEVETQKVVGKFFADLHAKLQVLEAKFTSQLKNPISDDIEMISQQIDYNLAQVKHMTKMGDLALLPEQFFRRHTKNLIQKLNQVTELPTCLVGKHNENKVQVQFNSGDILDNLHKYITLEINKPTKYLLLSKKQLAEDNVSANSSSTSSQCILNSPSEEKASKNVEEILNLTADVLKEPKETVEAADSSLSKELSPITKLPVKLFSPSGVFPKSLSNLPKGNLDELLEIPTYQESLQNGTKEKVNVTCIRSPSEVFVQLNKYRVAFDNLQKAITQTVKSQICYIMSPESGVIYATKSEDHENYDFVRCIVTQVNPIKDAEESYSMFYIDIGTLVTVKAKELRLWELPKNLKNIPPVAIKCNLFDITPKNDGWSDEALLLAKDILSGDMHMIVYKNSGPYSLLEVDFITVFEDDMYSLRDALIFMGNGVKGSIPPGGYVNDKNLSLPYITVKANEIPSKSIVRVSNIINPHGFFVQQVKHLDEFENFSMEVSKHYMQVPCHLVYVPYVRMPVVVNILKSWQRGIVADVLQGKGLVEVFLVDTGNRQIVESKKIRKLHNKFLFLECQAIYARLAESSLEEDVLIEGPTFQILNGIIPTENLNMEITKYGVPLTVVISDSISNSSNEDYKNTQSQLSNNSRRNSLLNLESNMLITEKELELQGKTEQEIKPKTVDAVETSWDIPRETSLDIPSTNNTIETILGNPISDNVMESSLNQKYKFTWLKRPTITSPHVDAVITYITENDYIYFHLQSEVPELENLTKMVQQSVDVFLTNHTNHNHFWTSGDACVVLYDEDCMWYRGIIIELHGPDFHVLMIDYGNDVIVKSNKVLNQILFPEIPQFARKAQLSESVNSNVIYEKYIATETVVEINISKHENDQLLITLPDNLNKIDCQVLQNPQDVLNNGIPRDYNLVPLPNETLFNINILCCLSYHRIVFKVDGKGINTPDFFRLQRDINSVGNDLKNLFPCTYGSLCVAKYSGDGLWHRGKICSRRKNNQFMVFFVDIGKKEHTKSFNIKETKTEWTKFPLETYVAELFEFEVEDPKFRQEILSCLNKSRSLKCKIITNRPLKVALYDSESNKLSCESFLK